MKKINLLILLLSICIVVISTQSCEKDESCPTINCNTGALNVATCECDCLDGYEGANCETLMTAKFVGTYNNIDVCNAGTLPVETSSVSTSTEAIDRLNFTNFYGLVSFYSITEEIYGTVSGTTITIPEQTVTNGTTNITISNGSGTISEAGVITFTYTASNSTSSISCTSTWTLQ